MRKSAKGGNNMSDNKNEAKENFKEVVINNEKITTKEQLEAKKAEYTAKGVKLVETKPGVFRTKLEG